MRHLTLCILALTSLVTPTFAGETEDDVASLEALDRVRAAVAEKAARSVVQIHVERSALANRSLSRADRMRMGLRGYVPPKYHARPDGPVTGVVIAPGLVATSTWNLAGDGSVKVTGPNGTSYAAERVGRDESLSVALLKVRDEGTLKPIGRSGARLGSGRLLLLVGRSAQNRPTVMRGIVSGLARERGAAFTHSCRTSYGNVGGALVDMEGNLVGVAVRHTNRARQGQSSGVGFGARVERITANLTAMAKGEVIPSPPRAFLGIGLDQRHTGAGVRVGRVIEKTAAQKVGIQKDDVILVFNSVKIEHFNQLVEEILKLGVGTEIVVTIQRAGKEIDFKVKLGTRPEDEKK
jgi:serine protease DegS